MFDSFYFQNILSNEDGDAKNDADQLTNQLSRIYIGVIKCISTDFRES